MLESLPPREVTLPQGEPVADPVCGMQVDTGRAAARRTHAGRTYYFCCDGCADRFDADPEPYLKAPPTPTPTNALPHPAVGRYTCPMHPEVIREGPGACPICGMSLEPLVPAEGGSMAADPELRDMTRRFVLGLLLTVPIFALSMTDLWPSLAARLAPHARPLGFLQLLLATPVVFYCGWPLLMRGRDSLRNRRLNMFTLIAGGTGIAYLASVMALLLPDALPAAFGHGSHAPIYFETAAVITVLVLLGQVLELKARGATGEALRHLAGLLPRTALCRDAAGREIEVPLEQVRPGNLLLVKPGARVPVDGVVIEGRSAVDESLLTGESVPAGKAPGDALTGGSINGTGALLMKAERVGSETLLAEIVRMVGAAQRSRAPIQRLADAVSAWFIPAVLATAGLAFAIWVLAGPEPRLAHALMAAVSVLIVACPCALGLATPMSIMVAAGRGAAAGVLFRNAEAIETLGRVDTLVVDKTGTLTEGRPRLLTILAGPVPIAAVPAVAASGRPAQQEDEAALLGLAAAVERRSEHPLAAAIVEAARERGLALPDPEHFDSVPGQGATGTVDGRVVVVGSEGFLRGLGIEALAGDLGARAKALRRDGQTVVHVAVDGRPAGLLGLSDPIRPSTPAALDRLRAEGLRIVMATGDNRLTGEAVAGRLGIDEVASEILPAGKRDLVERLKAEGGVVAMAGDGVNDAPALATAHVGIALGSGTAVAIGSAGVTLVRGDLAALLRARRLSRAALRNIRLNLFFAFAYNALCIPVAAGALYPLWGWLLSPMLASLAMSLSSVTVIANALRLRRLPL